MKKILLSFVLLLAASVSYAQNVRWDLGAPGGTGAATTQGSGLPFLVAVPNVQLNWCGYPANGNPCTNYASTYPSLTSTSACPTNTQIVLQGSSTCVATSDNFGNLGVYTPAGNYSYTLTISGVSYGPYTVSVGGSGNGSGDVTAAGNNAFTGSNNHAGSEIFTGQTYCKFLENVLCIDAA